MGLRQVIEATLEDVVVPETPWNLAELDTIHEAAGYGRFYENHRGLFWVIPLKEIPLLKRKLELEGPVKARIEQFEKETSEVPDEELWSYSSLMYPEVPVMKPLVEIVEYAVTHSSDMRSRKRQDIVFAQIF